LAAPTTAASSPPRRLDDRADDRGVRRIVDHVGDEAAVDLELVDR
jgi:hypothetical protein